MKNGLIITGVIAGLTITVFVQHINNTRLKEENNALQAAAAVRESSALTSVPVLPPAHALAQPTRTQSGAVDLPGQKPGSSNATQPVPPEWPIVERASRPDPSAAEPKPAGKGEEAAHELALAALQGDGNALVKLGDLVRTAVTANQPDLTPDEQSQLTANLKPVWAAFDLIAQEASTGKENALRVLAQAARIPDLTGLAMKSLGDLAACGSDGALNVILDPQQFGVDATLADMVGALGPAAQAENERAIEALAVIAADDQSQALWYLAAEGLGQAASSGNATAIHALLSLSRSTNASVQRSALAGLRGVEANRKPMVLQAP